MPIRKCFFFFFLNADNWKEGLRIYLAEIDQGYVSRIIRRSSNEVLHLTYSE